MSLPTIEVMTNLYLYGVETLPTDLVDDTLIRPTQLPNGEPYRVHYEVDINEYMSGPGRFATMDKFNIVRAFFESGDPDIAPTIAIPPGTYTKEELNSQFFGFEYYGLELSQSNYGTGDADHLERSYIWQTTAFKLDDRTRFVVEQDGTRYITNYAVTKHSETGNENFDFLSDSWSSPAGLYLASRIDPSGIGRRVEISFTTDRTISTGRYTTADYLADKQNSPEAHPIDGMTALWNQKETLVSDLWGVGIIRFLDPDNKAIAYGTQAADTLSAAQVDSMPLLKGYAQNNGVVLLGGKGADNLIGGQKDDKLYGGDDDDWIAGGTGGINPTNSGNDHLYGGAGNDRLYGGDASDHLYGEDGDDLLNGDDGDDWVYGGEDDDVAHGGDNDDQVEGGGGNDTLYGDDNEVWDAVWGGDDTLKGGAGDDLIYGEGGSDKLYGDEGDDQLDGGGGADRMFGGIGNDTYHVEDNNDTLTENADEGIDLVKSSATHTLAANIENLTLTGTAAINGTGNSLENIIVGNSAANTLSGGGGDDKMYGGGGDDTMNGGDGNDEIRGEDGANVMRGDRGNDTLIGGIGNDALEGGAGNDILIGAQGNDVMAGGDGDDIYAVNSSGDITSETATGGTDTVYTTASITLQSNMENLVVDLNATLTVTGNSRDNTMHGNAVNNTIKGGTGNDRIKGFGGDDILWGDLSTYSTNGSGGGDDALYGGDGADRLMGESGDDVLYGESGNDTLDGGYGNDVLYGGTEADSLTGGLGNDQLYGGLGMDSYLFAQISPLSSHTLGQDTISDEDMAGSITVGANTLVSGIQLQDGTWRANTGDKLSFIGDIDAGRVTLVIQSGYNKVNVSVQNFTNGDLGITLAGVANNNVTGTDGNDTLAGNNNANTLTGKKGDDTYTVNHAGDKVVELPNEGMDTVESSIASHELAANVENLNLIGSAIAGIGNQLNNTITGNALDNTLTGQGGADTLKGMEGADVMDGGAGADAIHGGLGSDVMAGGMEADTFFFDLFTAGNQDNDIISDFMSAQGDQINLAAIDANALLSGDQAFTFIGDAAFGPVAGQLRFGGDILSGDVNGDAVADFHVQLLGVNVLQLADLGL